MSKKQRNLRKARALHEQEALSDGDGQEDRADLEELRQLQQMRKRKGGLTAEALVSGSDEATTAGGRLAEELEAAYVKETAEVQEEEDPAMQAYVAEQLAKRTGKRVKSDAEALAEALAPPKESELLLPESLKAPRPSDVEISGTGTWVTGIQEVGLDVEYRLRNIEETEEAKRQLLQRAGGGARAAAAQEGFHRTMLPLSFGREQLIKANTDDSFVAKQMRQNWREQKKKKRG